MAGFSGWILAKFLLTLRIAPVFAFAPQFTLIRVPRTLRVLLALGLAASLVVGGQGGTTAVETDLGSLAVGAARELLLGATFVMAFQIAFAALYVAGRTIDIQAGFGLALLVDPTSKNQTPLVGTLFAYAAAAVFFASDGHLELVRLFAASLDAVPLGAASVPATLGHLTALLSVSFLIAFGVAGGGILVLFLVDLAIALLSRTVPQLNVLVLGFQLKTVVLLLVLPASFGFAGALLARLMATALTAIPGFF